MKEVNLEIAIVVAANQLIEAKKIDSENFQADRMHNLTKLVSNSRDGVEILRKLQG